MRPGIVSSRPVPPPTAPALQPFAVDVGFEAQQAQVPTRQINWACPAAADPVLQGDSPLSRKVKIWGRPLIFPNRQPCFTAGGAAALLPCCLRLRGPPARANRFRPVQPSSSCPMPRFWGDSENAAPSPRQGQDGDTVTAIVGGAIRIRNRIILGKEKVAWLPCAQPYSVDGRPLGET